MDFNLPASTQGCGAYYKVINHATYSGGGVGVPGGGAGI